MTFIRNRRGTKMVIAATVALCSLGVLWHAFSDPQPKAPRSHRITSSSTIPFDPPVMYPGYDRKMKVFKKERLRGNTERSGTRSLMFDNEDRKTFKALHPFVLDTRLPFEVLSPPYGRIGSTTMAILSTERNLTIIKAAAYSAYVRRQYSNSGKWSQFHVYVFTDREAAKTFAAYQKARKGRLLTAVDFKRLVSIWPKVIARYSYNSGREIVLYPRNNPNGWWINPSKPKTRSIPSPQ